LPTSVIETITPFVEPQSVALIGVSTRTGPGTFNILEELLTYGYKGKIFPVNPKGGSILNITAYTSVAKLPETPDVAVVSTPRTAVPQIVRDCVSKEIKGIIIITQGFTDADDDEGQMLHQEILESIKGTQTRIIGPNTLGVMNNFNRFNTSFIPIDSDCRNLGVICQSGIFMAGSGDFSGGIGIGIDIGNTSDLDSSDILEYMGEDNRIEVINLHLEGLSNGRRFLDVMRKVTASKPVLVLKTGTSEVGARAAGSHSGSLAGEDHVYNAAFQQTGAIRVTDVDQMSDLTETFLTYKSMPGKNIAIVTISGGAGIIAIDAVSNNNLQVAKFSTSTNKSLTEIFPAWMKPGNPTDIWPSGMSKGYHKILKQSMETILSDPGVDAVLLISPAYIRPENDPLNIINLIDQIAEKHPEKPTASWIFGPHRKTYASKLKQKGNIVVYPTANRAMHSLKCLHDYLNPSYPTQKNAIVELGDMQKDLVAGIIESNLMSQTTTLNEQALDIMHAYGIPVIKSGIATSPEQAVEKAQKLGYPIVMKVISHQITHKSDIGAVKLNIKTEEEVHKAWNEITETVSTISGARMLGVLIQQYCTGGTEIILGAKRDPQFGPVLIYGLGGIYTELLKDVSFRIAPITPEEARSMIKETRSYKILTGLRGNTAANIDMIVYSLVRLGQLMSAHPEIVEMDINPLLVDSNGAVALDGRIMLKKM